MLWITRVCACVIFLLECHAQTSLREDRTCFQTGAPWSEFGNLPADVAIVYGIDDKLAERAKTWREQGYKIHVMTGVSWGKYQDYLYGKFDGKNHEDEAQTVSDGRKSSHGGDVYYMCPTEDFAKYLCIGVQRALDAGAEAIHLEEPEFWVNSGYSAAFKREWKKYYGSDWQAPHSSCDAQWRASKLKYFLFRRALQNVFTYVQNSNKKTGKHVKCYVPTHSLLNYASWSIVSPESSLAQLQGCDGYIAQVWTGTARTPNLYRGEKRERTFETAYLEYAAMQNMVRATGRTMWFLNDPIEDNPNHDWQDYKKNWECTLTASLMQPDVYHYEIAPWPERIFRGRYPKSVREEERKTIPAEYATELQLVMHELNSMKEKNYTWQCGTSGIGVFVSDSLMFERGAPSPSNHELSHIYGMALPLLKRGMPVAPLQLENVAVKNYLQSYQVIMLSYQGMKPLSADVHAGIADWIKAGGTLVFCDDDSDPFNQVRDWWNDQGKSNKIPREHLFSLLKKPNDESNQWSFGKGHVIWMKEKPTAFAYNPKSCDAYVAKVKAACEQANIKWQETNHLILQRGPYVIASGLDESISDEAKVLPGKYINYFDPELPVMQDVKISANDRYFLRQLSNEKSKEIKLLAAACRTKKLSSSSYDISGIANTPAIMLFQTPSAPKKVFLADQEITDVKFSNEDHLLWIRFTNSSEQKNLRLEF